MKKLMIALAVVVSAVAVQAATVDWGASGTVFDWNNFVAPDGNIAFYLASDMSTPLASSPFAFDPDSGAFAGTVTGTDQADWVARVTINNFDGGGSYYKDYAFFMDSVTHAGAPDAAAYLSGLGSTIGDLFSADLDLMASPASQGYAPVPEPTSGLLLLIGVAGLALKRKRA